MIFPLLAVISQIVATKPTWPIDSIVLERSHCFGFCPAYRVSAQRNGAVNFRQDLRGNSKSVSYRIADSLFMVLEKNAWELDWDRFPNQLNGNNDWCHISISEGTPVTVSVFQNGVGTVVRDFTTCSLARAELNANDLKRLRAFQLLIDVVTETRKQIVKDPGPEKVRYTGVARADSLLVQRSNPPIIDSIVLTRSACLGGCPVYRLSVARSGVIAFRDVRQKVLLKDSLFDLLSDSVRALNLGQYPRTILADSAWCGAYHTDHPTVALKAFMGENVVSVVDYRGCGPTIQNEVPPKGMAEHWAKLTKLRAFTDFLDRMVDTPRLLRGGNEN